MAKRPEMHAERCTEPRHGRVLIGALPNAIRIAFGLALLAFTAHCGRASIPPSSGTSPWTAGRGGAPSLTAGAQAPPAPSAGIPMPPAGTQMAPPVAGIPMPAAGTQIPPPPVAGIPMPPAGTQMPPPPVAGVPLPTAGTQVPPVAGTAMPPAPMGRLDWWREARFGMFIHWGPVALTGTEIGWSRGAQVPKSEYDQLYKRFNPVNFDADAWVLAAKQAGMRYMVLTTKHHDGFALWPSKHTNYHMGNTPFQRDVVRELSDACKRHGIRFGAYYSIADWYHPDYPTDSPHGKQREPNPNMPRYYEYLKNQNKELIENYGPLAVMWFDGEWEDAWTREYGNALYDWLLTLQPSLIINNRVSKGRQGLSGTTTQSQFDKGDYDTPEQEIGKFSRKRPWESCITICKQWAWKPNDQLKSRREVIRTLIYTVGGDGNLLLNVGPTPEGRIEQRQVARLTEMGVWLQSHGEAVYGTRGGPFKPGPWGAATCKQNKIYLFVMQWPSGDALQLPPIPHQILGARALSGGKANVQQSTAGITVQLPAAQQDPVATVIELTLSGKAFDIQPLDVTYRSGSLAFGKPANASTSFQGQAAYAASMAVDDNPDTRWATDTGTRAAWLEVDLGAPTAIGRIVIHEPAPYHRVQAFELQVFGSSGWQTFHRGTTIGSQHEVRVQAITARRFRLNILNASDGPTIAEFQLFGP